jgi:hypothetical protein
MLPIRVSEVSQVRKRAINSIVFAEIRELLRYIMSPLRISVYCFFIMVILGASSMLLPSCGDNLVTNPRDIVFPAQDVSYISHVQPLMNLTCNYSGCHNTQTRAGNIDLTSCFDVMSARGVVIAGNPEGSILSLVVSGKVPHPLGFQGSITQNHIDGIKTWIAEGAECN